MASTLLIRNGRIVDPSQEMDQVADLVLENGTVAAIGRQFGSSSAEVYDARGKIVSPGLIDMHVHLREPGNEEKETIESGTAAAAAGGFTAVACMPNTQPALDDDTQIEFVLRQAKRAANALVYPIGAITKRREGKELAEIGLMVRAGAVGFSDDGVGVENPGVMLRALQYIGMFKKLVIQHCEDRSLAGKGVMHQGTTSTRLGMPAIPAMAEDLMVQRDITLAKAAGARYHVAHISTAGAVDLVRQARLRNQAVSTEVCPHHLLLTDEACATYDPNMKMNPPLRSKADVAACLEGVRDGTIDCLITDHAPHQHSEKELGFQDAPFGILGLETALPLFIQALITPKIIDWPRLIRCMSTRPAELLGVAGGTLNTGARADVTIIDPDVEWTIDAAKFRSRSRNTPFDGWKVRGRAAMTILGGKVTYRSE